MSQSDETLSPAVSSTGFSTFAEAKLSLDAALANYESSDPEDHTDDTKRFLESKIYPVGPKDREVIDAAFQPLHDQGKMSYTTGHTATGFPVFVVWRTTHRPGREPERKGRAVVDLRPLNKEVVRDIYPIPTMDDILLLTQGKKFITVLDASKFFYQWRVRREHRGRICVVSHRGQEKFHVAIMGFCNSVPYVQRQMDLLLKEFVEFCRAYLDDLVTASDTFDEHVEHLTLVLDVLEKHGVALEPKKAYVAFPEVSLLGQRVDGQGVLFWLRLMVAT
ncbi:hypothetical protein DTO013E5_5507 [Penicillium roqueforti]|uniref:uncharacterized protein n=1 Tax=Penicillium roqueforti TaxID=5082 RepID=UPI00190D95F1|nr:uncharacterized protein LCP9604111_3369 [Penicillium roqueforti]KAF9250467.1 hypothetical protein LCP9604111_3369 [Penicillium roqueforti]KAI1833154.1 hypothetical protein CBS147337_6111 [Penicillium roqueforti]KAI2740466.1 hypothetical protein DTO012A1_5381 [Penicillium roqueforti]KAI2752726.1 hypothetical protein DTO013F2_2955 [Penicillium roqueforti]KAI2759894.1 hypothetical protein DTO006G1_5307 [Penicillium roqueforti]